MDRFLIFVMIALFLLTLTITFSPAHFPKEYGGDTASYGYDDNAPHQHPVRSDSNTEEDEDDEDDISISINDDDDDNNNNNNDNHNKNNNSEDEDKDEDKEDNDNDETRQDKAFAKRMAKQFKEDKAKWAERRRLMSAGPPSVQGPEEWADRDEAKCERGDCPWKGPYIVDGKGFRQEDAGCDPRSRQCRCLEDWKAAKQCPETFPEEKRVTIAVTGWLLDFMGQYIEGDYDCEHSSPHVVNFIAIENENEKNENENEKNENEKKETEAVIPDIYLSSDVPFVANRWQRMMDHKHKYNPDAKMAMLYIEAEPHVGTWFTCLPELDISLTFYDWADIHITHIQDHPSWFRNAPHPFHLKRNVTFINSGCYGHRTAIVKEVMKYMDVENLGECLKNADYCQLFPLCCKGPWHGSFTSRYVEKECLIHYYKFVLALENTVSYNYTTEKFFQPLKMGTVPIYWGSNSSSGLVPGEHAVIRVDDFPSIKHMTDYMKELIADEDKYNKHLEWKWKPYREAFMSEARDSLSTFMCRLSDAYVQGRTFYGATRMPDYAEKHAKSTFPPT